MAKDLSHKSISMTFCDSFISYTGPILNSYGSEITRWHIYFGNKNFGDQQIRSHIKNKKCLYINQVHGFQILEAEPLTDLTCDGLTTESDLYALAIKTADCLPIMIVHKDRIFAIHAGWRGLEGGILFSTKLFDLFGSNTLAFIGPHIQFRSFEVGREVVDLLFSSLANQTIYFDRDLLLAPHARADKAYLNLSYLARLQLLKLGLLAENIIDSKIDTLSDLSWHSYRRDALAAGRNVHLIFKS